MAHSFTPFIGAAAAVILSACGAIGASPEVKDAKASEAASIEDVWRPFSDDSPWNTPISDSAIIDAKSSVYTAELAKLSSWHININKWSVPVYEIDLSSTPSHQVRDIFPGEIGRGFDFPREIPIPANAMPSLPENGSRLMVVVDRERALEWDMSKASLRDDGNWYIGFGAITNLRGTGVYRPWSEIDEPESARTVLPSGFPLLAGLIRVEEIEAGRIDHALVFSTSSIAPNQFVPPAATARALTGEGRTDGLGLPLGARIQLDPEWDVDGADLSREGKIIARALQTYGAYLGDYADGNVFFAESSPAALKKWDGLLAESDLHAVFSPQMIAENFRVMELGDVLPGQPVADTPSN